MLVIVGGIIPENDIPTLKEQGVAAVFTPGAPLDSIGSWLGEALDAREDAAARPEAAPMALDSRHVPPSTRQPHTHDTPSDTTQGEGTAVDLYEYQGKQYFARFGIPTSPGGVADTVDEAVVQADAAGYPVVVKAQVKVGGRGKAGGVKLAADADEVRLHAGNILGLDIKGHVVKRLWVEHASDIDKEYYASFTLDRPNKLHLGMLSAEGGVEIEEVAVTNPDAIAMLHINPLDGLDEATAREWVDRANLDPEAREQAATLLVRLYHCYVEGDCDLAEINPLILTPEGKVHALDAKVTLDENASYRHPEWEEYDDDSDIDPREKMAKEKGLNYIGLTGSVGIIANGAGLAMSTLDVVTQAGGEAANFLDIGGGANADVMAAALEVINADPAVRSIFVNIFGGITRVDEVAKGIIEAMGRVKLSSPGRHAPRRHQRHRGPGPPGRPPVRPVDRRAHHARRRPPRRRPGQGLRAAREQRRGQREHLRRRDDQGRHPGHQPDQPGPLPRPAQQGLRHQGGGRDQPQARGRGDRGHRRVLRRWPRR